MATIREVGHMAVVEELLRRIAEALEKLSADGVASGGVRPEAGDNNNTNNN